jgi:beta-lactamase class A
MLLTSKELRRFVRTAALVPTLALLVAQVCAQTIAQSAVCPPPAKGAGNEKALQNELDSVIAAHHGKVALYAEELGPSGLPAREIGVDADKTVQTASVIKLGILYEAMMSVREGRARWDEKITLKPGDSVPGSGLLLFLDTPLTLTLKDVLTLMVIVSDNTATNLAIDRFGLDAVNARMASLGLKNTYLYKKIFKAASGPMPADQPKFGLGKTTPREMAQLMADIGTCRLQRGSGFREADEADLTVCRVALGMLKGQFYRETVPRYLPNGGDGATASKTGSLDAVRNDVAIVMGKNGPMVLSIFTYDNADHSWTVDNQGEVTVAKLAKSIVNAWSPEGLDGTKLVPGLGLAGQSACSAAAGPGL